MSETPEDLARRLISHVELSLKNHLIATENSYVAMQKVYAMSRATETDRTMLPVIWQIYEATSEMIQSMILRSTIVQRSYPTAVSPEVHASIAASVEIIEARDKAIRELREMIKEKFDV